MTFGTVGLACVDGGYAVPVQNVYFIRDGLEMGWPHATSIATFVINDKAIGDRSDTKNVATAVGRHPPSAAWEVVGCYEYAVSGGSASLPLPAGVSVMDDLNVVPEPVS